MRAYASQDTGQLLPHPVDYIPAALRCGLSMTVALRLYRELGARIRTSTFLRYWQEEQERRSAWRGQP